MFQFRTKFFVLIRTTFMSYFSYIRGIEAMNMIRKGQVKNLNYSGLNEAKYINQLFGIVL